jgi:hypothetical protein
MRRTKASLIYRRTKNLRAAQLLLEHTNARFTISASKSATPPRWRSKRRFDGIATGEPPDTQASARIPMRPSNPYLKFRWLNAVKLNWPWHVLPEGSGYASEAVTCRRHFADSP